jgi:hypothetical protein
MSKLAYPFQNCFRQLYFFISKTGRCRWMLVLSLGFQFLYHAPAWSQAYPLNPVLEIFPSSGQAPLTVLISGSKSTGKWGTNGSIESWEFDPDYDGVFNPAVSDPVFDYTYDQPGTYICRMRITDIPSNSDPREAFAELVITVTESTRDPGKRSKFPPNVWGAGINYVWASDEQQAAVAQYITPMDQINIEWNEIEPEEYGTYDWTKLDKKLKEAFDRGRCASVRINPPAPNWLFDHIAKTGTSRDMPSPQFWDPDYIQYYKDMITTLARYLSSHYKNKVLFVRQQWNAVHEETCFFDKTVGNETMGTWKDNPNWVWPSDGHRYEVEWTEDIALDYERQIQRHFISEFEPTGIGVTLRVIESHLPDDEIYAYFSNDNPTEWLLQTNNAPLDWDEYGTAHTHRFVIMRCFGSAGFDETWKTGKERIEEKNPALSLQQDIYGVVLRALAVGVSYIGIKGDDLEPATDDVEYQETFNFGNKYAGWHLYPKSAPGAWIVLGEFKGSTNWRWLNTLTSKNWGYFLRQNSANETSTPRSLVGRASCRFGIYAREIEAETSFDLDDSFAAAIQNEPVEVRVIFNESSGTFSLQADRNGTLETLTEDRYEDHKGWRTSIFRIDEPRFADGPDGQTDIAIIPESGTPIIHMIEIDRFSTIPEFDKGDTDNDYEITLKDAVLAIRVLSALAPDRFVKKEADINADGKIGVEEVIFILRKISGME